MPVLEEPGRIRGQKRQVERRTCKQYTRTLDRVSNAARSGSRLARHDLHEMVLTLALAQDEQPAADRLLPRQP